MSKGTTDVEQVKGEAGATVHPEGPLKAGEAGLRRLSEVLGLPPGGSAGSGTLASVELSKQGLWFLFTGKDGSEAWIQVAAAGGDPWLASGRNLKCGYRGSEVTPLVRAAVKLVLHRLDGTPFAKLEQFVRLSAASSKLQAEQRSKPEVTSAVAASKNLDEVLAGEWGAPNQWREFCGFPVAAGRPWDTFFGHLQMTTNVTEVRHGDVECQDYLSLMAAGSPWVFTRHGNREGGQPSMGNIYLTHLSDRDVVLGAGARKAESLLEELDVASVQGGVQLFNCCVPMMTGDAVRVALERFGERSGVAVVYTDMSPLTESSVSVPDQFDKQVLSLKGHAGRSIPGSYNLVGFGATDGRDELIRLLAAASAILNGCVLPEFELGSLASLARASAQACLPNIYHEPQYQALAQLGIPTMTQESPFGLAGSLAWLRSLAGLLGSEVAGRMEEVLSGVLPGLQEQWSLGKLRASQHLVGFVVAPGDVQRLFDVRLMGGVSVPVLLREMGFRLQFLSYQEPGGRPPISEEELRLLAVEQGGVGFSTFGTQHELERRLRECGLSSVYSNLRGDKRLARAGILGFSLNDVDMGLEGALETQRRILRICETPFLKKYGKYLQG